MTSIDLMSLGGYLRDEPTRLDSGAEFRELLKACVNLKKLGLQYYQDLDTMRSMESGRIDLEWLKTILDDQFWPQLRQFELASAQVDPLFLLDFFEKHKSTLVALLLFSLVVPSPRTAVELCNGLRDRLSLIMCKFNSVDFFDDEYDGLEEYEEFCHLYADNGDDDRTPNPDLLDFGVYVLGQATRGRRMDDGKSHEEYGSVIDRLDDPMFRL